MSSATQQLRRALHAQPELSGNETATTTRLLRFFRELDAGFTFEKFDDYGFAAILSSPTPGRSIMLRAELDALPIVETNQFAHRSRTAGVAHQCGHDGHMAILAEVGVRLAAAPPPSGRVILLFQAAEETGVGARAIVHHPRFQALAPDRVFALHNLPGFPMAKVIARAGTFSCASCGMRVLLKGLEAHAAQPETGRSPAMAMARIITALNALGPLPDRTAPIAFVTVVHATLGQRSFGIAPGSAELMLTLRGERDELLQELITQAEDIVSATCAAQELQYSISFADAFPACHNDPAAYEEILAVTDSEQLQVATAPFRWSEDFGLFTARYPGTMFGLGAGEDVPALHHPQYDFPDPLIATGSGLFLRLIENMLGLRAS